MCEKEIIKQVKNYFELPELPELTKERTAEMCRAKWAAVYLLKTETNLKLEHIAPLLGLGTNGSASICFSRSLQEMTKNHDLIYDIAKISERLKNHN